MLLVELIKVSLIVPKLSVLLEAALLMPATTFLVQVNFTDGVELVA